MHVFILPYLELTNLYDQFNFTTWIDTYRPHSVGRTDAGRRLYLPKHAEVQSLR